MLCVLWLGFLPWSCSVIGWWYLEKGMTGAKTEADTKELTSPRLAVNCTHWHWMKSSLKGSLSGTSPCLQQAVLVV